MQARPWFCCNFCQYLSHKLCNLVFIQKGTLELHNLERKLPFDTSFGLVRQHLLPSKTDLSAVLLRTAHTITIGAVPVISHYNVYPLSWRKYQKRYPGAKIYGCWGLFWYVARCVWRKGSFIKVESKCSVYNLCEMGLPTVLAVFALCVVLLEPASAARGQNRVPISIERYYFRKM